MTSSGLLRLQRRCFHPMQTPLRVVIQPGYWPMPCNVALARAFFRFQVAMVYRQFCTTHHESEAWDKVLSTAVWQREVVLATVSMEALVLVSATVSVAVLRRA